MPIYSYYIKKKLVYIAITAPFSHRPSFYIKCTKLNIYSSCNIRLVSNTKYTFMPSSNVYNLSQLLGKNTW